MQLQITEIQKDEKYPILYLFSYSTFNLSQRGSSVPLAPLVVPLDYYRNIGKSQLRFLLENFIVTI